MLKDGTLSKKTLEEIVETSVDAIIVIDDRGIIQYVNQATLFLFLYQKKDLVGQNVSILMPMPDRASHDRYMNNYKDTGKKKIIGIGREVKAVKKNKVEFSCLLALSEVQLEDKRLFTGIIHDISKLKKAETDLIDLNKSLELKVEERTEKLSEVVNRLLETNNELTQEVTLRKKVESALKTSEYELRKLLDKEKELSELKSRFVTMASHEFRTPLSTILSSTNLVSKYAELGKGDKVEVHLKKIKDNIGHLTSILNDFLSLGKWDEGKVMIKKTSFSWSEFLKDLLESLEGVLKTGQEFKLDIGDEELYTDKNLLKNSLINLVSNAIKYSDEGKAIYISSKLENNYFNIHVKDEGIGIPASEQKDICDRFYRASNATNIEGTGIGLNLVQSYAEALGGVLSLESKVGEGSTFSLKIKL